MNNYLTIADIAVMANVRESTIRVYRYRKSLPVEDAMVGRTPVWHPETIERWIVAHTYVGMIRER